MSITRQKQETVILFNEAEPEIYNYNGKMKRRLESLAQKHPAQVTLTKACPTTNGSR